MGPKTIHPRARPLQVGDVLNVLSWLKSILPWSRCTFYLPSPTQCRLEKATDPLVQTNVHNQVFWFCRRMFDNLELSMGLLWCCFSRSVCTCLLLFCTQPSLSTIFLGSPYSILLENLYKQSSYNLKAINKIKFIALKIIYYTKSIKPASQEYYSQLNHPPTMFFYYNYVVG